MTAPTFQQQHDLAHSFGDTVRQTLQRLTGQVPAVADVEAIVRAELTDLHRDLGEEHCRGLAESAAAPVAACLSSAQREEAEAALWFARTHRISSVTEALRWYVDHRHGALDAPLVSRCVSEFLLAKRAEGLRPATLKVHRLVLSKFAAEFGTRQPLAVTPADMSAYLLRTPAGRQRTVWTTLSVFFAWAVRLRYAFDNPVTLAQQRPRPRAPGRFIFTPAETKLLLRRVKFMPEVGFWVLALFAGLRVTEIKRLHGHPDPWRLINLRTGQIEIPSALSKTRARLVPIRPVLRQWLQWLRFKKLPLYPPNQRDKCRWVRAIGAARGENLPGFVASGRDHRYYNIARRTHLSYRLALPGAGYAEVAREAGNRESILRRYYENRVTARDARLYFALTPARV